MTIKQIESQIAKTLTKELGVTVTVTSRSVDRWTISGTEADACKAAAWLESKDLMTLIDTASYDESTVCYMASH